MQTRMAKAWTTLDMLDTAEGRLELRQRGEQDFLITVGGRVLMTSTARDSELKLAQWGCAPIANRPAPRVAIGGLGMGYTLRAALDALPADARVEVAELNARVQTWCEGPLSVLTQGAATDPRTRIIIADVVEYIREQSEPFDAVIWDLYEGPHHSRDSDPLYGSGSIRMVLNKIKVGGCFAIWSEAPDNAFERRLDRLKCNWSQRNAGHGGRKHVVYLIVRDKSSQQPKGRSKAPRA